MCDISSGGRGGGAAPPPPLSTAGPLPFPPRPLLCRHYRPAAGQTDRDVGRGVGSGWWQGHPVPWKPANIQR